MKPAASPTPPRSQPRSKAKLVVRQDPLPARDAEFPGQGQRLFQLFRPELMRAFAARPLDEEKCRA